MFSQIGKFLCMLFYMWLNVTFNHVGDISQWASWGNPCNFLHERVSANQREKTKDVAPRLLLLAQTCMVVQFDGSCLKLRAMHNRDVGDLPQWLDKSWRNTSYKVVPHS